MSFGDTATLSSTADALINFGRTIANSWRKLWLLPQVCNPANLNSAAIKSAALSISGEKVFLPLISSAANTLSIRSTSFTLITVLISLLFVISFCALQPGEVESMADKSSTEIKEYFILIIRSLLEKKFSALNRNQALYF